MTKGDLRDKVIADADDQDIKPSSLAAAAKPPIGDWLVDSYQPRTEIGRRLIALRRAYIEGGGKLMSCDEINAEVRERRGGVASAYESRANRENNVMNSLVFEAEIGADHQVHVTLPDDMPIGRMVQVIVKDPIPDEILENYEPRSEIDRLALAARRAYLDAGGKPMSWDEIAAEVRERRGGAAGD